MNKRTLPANITATLSVGATATAPYFDINVTQQLCSPACVDEVPVFNPTFSLKGVSNVGTSQYVATIHIEGVISYIPCNCGSCCTRSQVVSQDFTIPIFSATAISNVSIVTGNSQNGIARYSCCDCSKIFVSNIPLTMTITTT